MAEDVDYTDVLEGTVDEVKDAIRDLDEPDYEALLKAEEEGKDRKTVKEFIESRIPEEEDDSEESTELDEDEKEDVVEDIEEETSGGITGSFSGSSLVVAGLILGVLIGFVAADFTGVDDDVTGTTADPDLVRESIQTIAGVGLDTPPEVSEPVVRHSMYNMNVSTVIETENDTVEQQQEIYVTLDGEKMFLVQEQMGQTVMPIDVQQAVAQAEASAQQEQVPEGDEEELPEDLEDEVVVE